MHLFVGYAAGGPLDTSARLIAQWLTERLGQQFIVVNQPGAGSNFAVETVVRAPPDGYTLLQISASNAWNVTLYDNLKFNFIGDIVPVAGSPLFLEESIWPHRWIGRRNGDRPF